MSFSEPQPTTPVGADNEVPPPPAYSTPDYAQPGYAQPGYAQPGYGPAGYAQPGYAQPGYGPAGYAQPGYYYGPDPATAKNWMNLTAMICGITGLIFGLPAIAGIVFGHMGVRAVARGEADNKGMGIAGLILGYVVIAMYVLMIVGYFVLIALAVGSTAYTSY